LHPAREPLPVLRGIREQLGEYNFAGQYQQAPAPLGGGIVKREWLKTYAEYELPAQFDYVVQSWDTAAKATDLADYSVCTTWAVANKAIYLRDVWRQKVDYPELKRAALALAQRFQPSTILVEDKSSGIQLIQELAQAGIYGVKPCKPSGDKVVRLHLHTGTMATGQMRILHDAPWLPDYIAELTTFPRSRYADQVDSTTQALEWIKQTTQEPGIITYYRQLVEKEQAQQ
jgi:predicted phage terminase large subunit-like protein